MSSLLPDPIDTGLVRRALVIKLRHHGDVLLTSPVFSVLRRALPDAEIDALVYRETSPMLEGHPGIAQIHTIDRSWKKKGLWAQARAERGLISALRARRYDLVVHLTEHPRGAWLTRLLAPRYAVARDIEGASWFWRSSFTHYYRLPRRTLRHTVECNLDSLRRVGIQPLAAEKPLVLVCGEAAARRARTLLDQHALSPQSFIQIHPGSRWMFKCWPAEHYAALIERIAADGWRAVITAAPDARERQLVDAIKNALGASARSTLVDLAGALDLRELAALTREARAFFGVDSAPMHIAAAMQTPVVALFGPSSEIEWGPWQVAHRIVASEAHPCRPCAIDGCGGGKVSECLTSLPADIAHRALVELMAATER